MREFHAFMFVATFSLWPLLLIALWSAEFFAAPVVWFIAAGVYFGMVCRLVDAVYKDLQS